MQKPSFLDQCSLLSALARMALASVAATERRVTDGSDVEPIQFIEWTGQTSKASEQNRHLIRSHIAKSNRRKRAVNQMQRSQHASRQRRFIIPRQPSVVHGDLTAGNAIGPSLDGDRDAEESFLRVLERRSTYVRRAS